MTARRLLLVRHGLPDYRSGQLGDEPPGPPLSDIGWAQAVQAADIVRRYAPPALYASPFARTRQTAECIGRVLRLRVRCDGDLGEWHRTERLYDVSVRLTRWLLHWLRGPEPCAVVVSHASPLLAILRSALYLPHMGWHKRGHPDALEISSGDRFEVSMASVFELLIEPHAVTVRHLFHPRPRVHHALRGVTCERLPRPVLGDGENRWMRRPNWLHLLGDRSAPRPM